MKARVLVGMGVDAPAYVTMMRELAETFDASFAFLQVGEPSLVDELDRLSAAGATTIELVRAPVGAPAPARSWLRRVAGHWKRLNPHVTVTVPGHEVSGNEAELHSPAWQDVPGHRRHVLVCRGPRCAAKGAADSAAALAGALDSAGLGDDDVLLTQTGCLFPCNNAPVVVVHPDDVWYGQVTEERAQQIASSHLITGKVLAEAALPRDRRRRDSPA